MNKFSVMRYLNIIFFLSISLQIQSQVLTLKKINKHYEKKEFAKIAVVNEVSDSENRKEILEKIANSNFFLANYEKAAFYYKIILDEFNQVLPETYYRYAQSLKATSEYGESDKWMKIYFELIDEQEDFSSDYLKEIEYMSDRHKIYRTYVNSKYAEFTASLFDGKLVYASISGINKRVHKMNNQPFLDLYQAELDIESGKVNSSSKLKGFKNRKVHESNAVFTRDGKTMYFTKNKKFDGERSKGKKKSVLGIFKATNRKNKWTKVRELPFGGVNFSVGHPALSTDERTLYFISDMAGGYGSTDIYKVAIKGNDKYGKVENLGAVINTPGKEMFPFISRTEVLYFSSDYHNGYGGLDVFTAIKKDGEYMKVLNLGLPLNSQKDDFGYILDESENKGFFTSNREGGEGDDDIYAFRVLKSIFDPCTKKIHGYVVDSLTKNPLIGSDVFLFDEKGNEDEHHITGELGDFYFEVLCEESYRLTAIKKGYINGDTLNFVSSNSEDYIIPLKKKEILSIAPIYFDLDRYNIRKDAALVLDGIVLIMNDNPTLKILGASHTDSRGSSKYNELLSSKRAEATVNYIISKGISENRISSIGYGESQLVNNCASGIVCSEDDHQENRRTEFIILEE
jgi:outer membrane protein OmpA-like peptidoglycan-associated protein